MCGIHGIISKTLKNDEIKSILSDMGDLQRHRGPDDKQEILYNIKSGCVGFGFVRLSILDLETGMQPIQCPLDQSAIICNGQIYNYIELRSEVKDQPFVSKGDIEVALHLYRVKGINFLNYLNGMYAGAIFDKQKGKLILFRDRFGIKPLYYTQWDHNFAFSSEVRPLLQCIGSSKQLNTSRISTFFTYRYVPGEETMFLGIKRLLPGHFLEYDLYTGDFRVERYWEYRLDRINSDLTLDEAAEEFYWLFQDAVKIRLRSDVEVGCLLSGGIDSSAVASQVAKQSPTSKLFTMAFDDGVYNELPSVKKFLAINKKRFQSTDHKVKLCGKETLDQIIDIVRAIEEPISLGAVLPTEQVCQLASEYVKVVLTGEGADEIFAGYRKFLLEMAASQYEILSKEEKLEIDKFFPELAPYLAIRDNDPVRRYIQSELLFNKNELKELLGQLNISDFQVAEALPVLSGKEHPLNAALAIESRFRLPDYVILRLDKLSMKHSLETRTPFLDFRLAEFAATLPAEFKVNLKERKEKFICRYAFEKYSILDSETANRVKQPFTIPLADWLSDPKSLPESMQEIILGDVVKQQGILNDAFVKKLVGTVSADGIGPQTLVSAADRVFAVVMFSLWYNEFFGS
ncbi:MAG: asparagine synthase (glutamine-hydrolyzing) [Desulfobacterales bacterium]|nr:asparagine synthase (glutamine-hydrolyzing) [Desulfobacterales bacterium]